MRMTFILAPPKGCFLEFFESNKTTNAFWIVLGGAGTCTLG